MVSMIVGSEIVSYMKYSLGKGESTKMVAICSDMHP